MSALLSIFLWFILSMVLVAYSIYIAAPRMMRFREAWYAINMSDVVWSDSKRRKSEFLILLDYHINEDGEISKKPPIYRYYNIVGLAILFSHLLAVAVMIVVGLIFQPGPLVYLGFMAGATGTHIVMTQFMRFSLYANLLDSTLRIYRHHQEQWIEYLYKLGYTIEYNGVFYFTNGNFKTPASISRDYAIDLAVKELVANLFIIEKGN